MRRFVGVRDGWLFFYYALGLCLLGGAVEVACRLAGIEYVQDFAWACCGNFVLYGFLIIMRHGPVVFLSHVEELVEHLVVAACCGVALMCVRLYVFVGLGPVNPFEYLAVGLFSLFGAGRFYEGGRAVVSSAAALAGRGVAGCVNQRLGGRGEG